MLLWIVIYSFFPSNDFRDEVAILFASVPFWSSVLLSVTVALGVLCTPSHITFFLTHPHSSQIALQVYLLNLYA